MRRALVVSVLIASSACVVDLDDGDHAVVDDGVAADLAPLIGVDGAGDFADRSCQIVLRDFGRVTSGSGFAVRGSSWIFEGRVDVSRAALAEGFAPALLVKAGSDPAWRALAPIASTGIDADTDRFLFHLDDGNLPGPGMSGTGLSRSQVAVIPFLQRADSRLFDHNRVVDAFATYVLQQQNGFAVGEDASVCAAPAGPTLTFGADFSVAQSGPVIGGRSVAVDYDVARSTACRAAPWSVTAHATFLPMNVRQSATVVDGSPAQLSAPAGARALVLYFVNSDSSGCTAYDSDFGANFHFAVVDEPGVAWAGNARAALSRGGSGRCDGAVDFGSRVVFGSWARQRAAITDLCFEAYAPGVTDVDVPVDGRPLWQHLDVQVHHRFDPAAPFATDYVSLVDRVGNNARYAIDLRPFDPFAWGTCNGAPVSTVTATDGAAHVQATLEVFFTINGTELRPDGGGAFQVVYDADANTPRVTCE